MSLALDLDSHLEFDPMSNRWQQDPYPVYRALRDRAPVHYAAESDNWVVSRYDDVVYVLKTPEIFASKRDRDKQMPGGDMSAIAKVRLGVSLLARMRIAPWSLGKSRFLVGEDGDVHTAMRSIVNRGFTPRRVAVWKDRARELAVDGVAQIRAGQTFDLVRDLAVPLPVTIIAEMLGVESEKMRDFKRWSDAFISGGTGSGRESGLAESPLLDAMVELRLYLRPIIKARRAHPTDDLISALVGAEGDAALSDFELFLFIFLLLLAGNETTTNLLTNTVDALLANPDELAKVNTDPSLIPNLIEEVLRWDSPVQMVQRQTTREVKLHGVEIPAGVQVAVMLGAANRDERRFEDPDRFDVTRVGRDHMSFGFGAHFCLGASLARLEAAAALEALLPELPRLERIREEREFVDSYVVRGLTRLELRAA